MTDLERLSRFYGMPLSQTVLDAVDEGLTDRESDDLFDAHLRRNYGYFGSLDKTLSGFVVLDNEGDDAWLYDARDTGAVFFQDHDERRFAPRLKTLEDYVAFRAELAQARQSREDGAREAVEARWFQKAVPPSKRAVPTAKLAKRLQWAVWFFGQPFRQMPHEADRHAEEVAPDHLPTDEEIATAFERELPQLADDPHLAIYWLLLTTALDDLQRFRATLAAVRDRLDPEALRGRTANQSELFQAFAAKLFALGPTNTLAVLPAFRRRRARLLYLRGLQSKDPTAGLVDLLKAIAFDPDDRPLTKALTFADSALKTQLSPDEVRAKLHELSPSLARDAGELVVCAHTSAKDAALATRVVHALLELPRSTDHEGQHRFDAFSMAGSMLAEPALALRAARHFLAEDPFHFTALAVAAEAAAALGDPEGAALSARHEAVAAIRPIYLGCYKGQKAVVAAALEQAAALDPAQRQLFLQKILASPETFEDAAIDFCLIAAVGAPFPGRAAAFARALPALSFVLVKKTLAQMRAAQPEPDQALAAELEAVVDALPPVTEDDFLAQSARGTLLGGLLPWLGARRGPEALEALLSRLETGNDEVRTAILGASEGYGLARMSAAQATRVARVLVQIQAAGKPQRGGKSALFHAAGHELYRFDHPGAEGFLVEQLRSAPREAKDLVTNLYAAVRRLGTSAAGEALIEQLFHETTQVPQLTSALQAIWTPELHARILAAIGAHPKAIFGADNYCAALTTQVKRAEPLHALGALALTLTPSTKGEAARLADVLWEALRQARADYRVEPARKLLAAAKKLGGEAGLAGIADANWTNPFVTKEGVQLVAELESGSLEVDVALARSAVAGQGHPLLRTVDDATLAALAQTAIGERLFHDPESGTLWALAPDRRFVYFDGYTVRAPPFEVHDAPALGDFVKGEPGFAARRAFWTEKADRFVDLARFGARLFFQRGVNNGHFDTLGLVFPSEHAAEVAFERYTAPKDFAETKPWEVDGFGPIVRGLFYPETAPTGTTENTRASFSAETPEAVAAAEATYWRTLAEKPGTRVNNLEWRARKPR